MGDYCISIYSTQITTHTHTHILLEQLAPQLSVLMTYCCIDARHTHFGCLIGVPLGSANTYIRSRHFQIGQNSFARHSLRLGSRARCPSLSHLMSVCARALETYAQKPYKPAFSNAPRFWNANRITARFSVGASWLPSHPVQVITQIHMHVCDNVLVICVLVVRRVHSFCGYMPIWASCARARAWEWRARAVSPEAVKILMMGRNAADWCSRYFI